MTMVASTPHDNGNGNMSRLKVPSVSTSTPDLNSNEWQWPSSSTSTLTSTRGHRRRKLSNASASSQRGSDLTDDQSYYGTESETPEPEVPPTKCSVDHAAQGREMINKVIACDVDTLFALLFSGSTFFSEFHAGRKTFDIKQSDWEEQEDGRKARRVSFTVTLTQSLGPKHSHLTDTQTLLPESRPGHLYAIDTEINNAGIPHADSFYVTTHFCLSRCGSQESNLLVHADVRYRKSVMRLLKVFIEKGTWDGMTEFYGHLERALEQECAKSNYALLAPGSLTRAASMRIRKQRPARKNYRAPPPPIPVAVSSLTPNEVPGAVAAGGHARFQWLWSWFPKPSCLPAVDSASMLKILLIVLTVGLLVVNVLLYAKIDELERSLARHTAAAGRMASQVAPDFLAKMKQEVGGFRLPGVSAEVRRLDQNADCGQEFQ